ncbi:MAG: hypothetical protein ABIT05_07265 [Chitinophagaceae bacterium]
MKRILLITGLVLSGLFVSAQEGKWKIQMNGKTLFYTSTENEKVNIKKISTSEWKKAGYLEISFKEREPDMWKRSFSITDENDVPLLTIENSTKAKIPLSKLRKLFAGRKVLTIYTIIAPVNPMMAIRMRRVHLCTLQLR